MILIMDKERDISRRILLSSGNILVSSTPHLFQYQRTTKKINFSLMLYNVLAGLIQNVDLISYFADNFAVVKPKIFVLGFFSASNKRLSLLSFSIECAFTVCVHTGFVVLAQAFDVWLYFEKHFYLFWMYWP